MSDEDNIVTYEDLRLKARGARSRQVRFLIKRKAQNLFPGEFDDRDFCLKRFQRMTYKELVAAHEVDTESRENIRRQARKRKEYKAEDFPLRKPGKRSER